MFWRLGSGAKLGGRPASNVVACRGRIAVSRVRPNHADVVRCTVNTVGWDSGLGVAGSNALGRHATTTVTGVGVVSEACLWVLRRRFDMGQVGRSRFAF